MWLSQYIVHFLTLSIILCMYIPSSTSLQITIASQIFPIICTWYNSLPYILSYFSFSSFLRQNISLTFSVAALPFSLTFSVAALSFSLYKSISLSLSPPLSLSLLPLHWISILLFQCIVLPVNYKCRCQF